MTSETTKGNGGTRKEQSMLLQKRDHRIQTRLFECRRQKHRAAHNHHPTALWVKVSPNTAQ